MKNASEGYIDEYNQLREEIRMYLEHGTKNLQIALTLGAAAVTFGSNYPELLIVSSLIVSYMWYDEIRHLRAIQRIATYLEVCVEPHVSGLNWETINSENPFDTSFVNRAIANAPFPTLVIVQALYAFYLRAWPFWLGIVVVSTITIYLAVLSYWTAKYGRKKERDLWLGVLNRYETKNNQILD
ncbi:MAG: hypothetical protein HYZ34_05650 [Ignavibacteriae bacterium]|nr:hypothetical protein [Ignavibacteriota bacterium]